MFAPWSARTCRLLSAPGSKLSASISPRPTRDRDALAAACAGSTCVVSALNRNFDLRREFMARADKTSIKITSILNGAFLVSRDSEGAFDQSIKQVAAQHEKLTFKYTGPWPPYNFVNIRLKLERA